MKRILQKLLMICVLATCSPGMSAQEMVYPPEGLNRETWIMSYNDYRDIQYIDEDYPRDRRRLVTFEWDNNTLYIQGIFKEYPEAWMRAELQGNRIVFENALICENVLVGKKKKPLYAMAGYAEYYREVKSAIYDGKVGFGHIDPEDYERPKLRFTLSDDRETISSSITICGKYYFSPVSAFWYYTDTWGFEVKEGWDEKNSWSFPETDYPVNVRFKKFLRSDVENVIDDENTSDATIYDLQGRKVNPDNLRPGIYIRNGKKLVIK